MHALPEYGAQTSLVQPTSNSASQTILTAGAYGEGVSFF
jgi:hypothetical protein